VGRKNRATSATPGTTVAAIWKDKQAPPRAQPTEKSTHTILTGVARNVRLVLGDENDVLGAKNRFNSDFAAVMDDLLEVARKRRSGEWVV